MPVKGTYKLYKSQIQHTIPKCRSYVLFPILQLYMRHVLKCLLIIVHLEKFLDVKHGLLNVVTEPARVLHMTETKMSCEFRKAAAGSSFSSAFTVSAYCVWAGELAGDVECYKCFSNNYIRHAITIIGHLQTEKDTFELLHKALSIRTYWNVYVQPLHLLGQIHHQHQHILGIYWCRLN